MKPTNLFLLGLLIFMVSCTGKLPQGTVPPADYQACSSDSDCIPQPGCHPVNCINSAFAGRFKQPDACTEMYSCAAAYSKEDCLCKDSRCINKKTIEGDPNCNN